MSSLNQVITLGCRLNTYESKVIQDLAAQAGVANTVFINTCAVTAEAERQARQTIRKMYRANPDVKIVVTGCSAQINPAQYQQMPEVSKVICSAYFCWHIPSFNFTDAVGAVIT